MLNILLLAGAIEFGVEKGCADQTIERLEPIETTIQFIQPNTNLFKLGTFVVKDSLPTGCSLINTESVIEFDITGNGELTNYKILSSSPNHIHSRVIKRALKKAEILPEALGTANNKIKVTHIMYKNKN